MVRGPPALVNHELLIWARKERGYELEEAAKKIGVTTEKLAACESDLDHLTIAQFRNAAWVYRRPTAIFYLDETPTKLKTPVFRRVNRHEGRPLSSELRLEIRSINQKRKVALELGDARVKHDWSFVGSINLHQDPEQVGPEIRKMLGISDRFPIGLRDYQAFNSWRQKIESTDTLVFLIRGVDVEEMRGFSISDKPFPVIAANRKDVYGPRCFTLLHEFCHVLLGDSSLCEIHSEYDDTQSHEVFCNHAAGAALVPSHLLLNTRTVVDHGLSESWTDKELQILSSRFRVSKEVILRRLLILNKTTDGFYGAMKQAWKQQIPKAKKSTPIEYMQDRVLRTDGLPFTSLVLDALHNDVISAADASEILRINLKHLPALEKRISEKGY